MTIKEDSSLLKKRILAAIPCFIAALAFCCSYVGNFYCDNVQFEPMGDIDESNFFHPRPLSFGLWMYREQKITNRLNGKVVYSESCSGYDDAVEMDESWRIARAFSCISVIIAGFLILWQFCAPFLLFDNLYWRWAMGIFTVIGVCQGMTLQFLSSNACKDNLLVERMAPFADIYPDTCSWDWGTRTSLASTILYFLTVVSMLIIPAPGIRPNERQFPMMVWDDAEMSSHAHEYNDNDDDDDSIDSFANDDAEYEQDKVPEMEDISETTNSQFDELEDHFTVSDVSNLDSVTSSERMHV